jgi:ArsR family transcriptional regulator, arsenate/arsenite/antimonite-responsive transcriptional repressor
MKPRSPQKPNTRRPASTAAQAPPPADAELALFAKALGHPVRVAILRHLLRHGECVCGALVEMVPLAQSTVSQHLKVLKEAGLLQGEIDGPRVCYCANRDTVRRLQQLIGDL